MVGRCFRHRDADIGVNGRRRYFAVWIAAQKPRSAVVATHDRELGRIKISPTIGLYTQTHKKENRSSLRFRLDLVARSGIEPLTHGFSVRCSTN